MRAGPEGIAGVKGENSCVLFPTEAFRVLKPGGRLAVSDIVALEPIPATLRTDFAAYTGCVTGAASVAEVEAMLQAAGFADVRVVVKESSRAFINDWMPGARAGDYVASADITARKPAQDCCGNDCCAESDRARPASPCRQGSA